MWLVEREHVGAVGYGRLQRDGAIRTLLPGLALARDIPETPSVRRHVLWRCTPPACQVTGLAVLWAQGFAPVPTTLDVRTPLGRHVRNWRSPVPLTFHATGVLPVRAATRRETRSPRRRTERVPDASVGLAIADALRWAPLALAIPAALSALTSGTDDAQARLMTEAEVHIQSDKRALSAWSSVRGALLGRESLSSNGREGSLARY